MNAEEKILEDRLINWGRWNQDPKRQGRSPLCAFMEAVPNDDKDVPPAEQHDEPPPVDVKDALLVQRAWQRMPMSPERYRMAKVVLGVAYTVSGSFEHICYHLRKYHRIRVRERDFDQLLDMGKKVIRNNILKLDQCKSGL